MHEDLRGDTVALCIRGVPFRLTRERVSKALDIPIILLVLMMLWISFVDDLSFRVLTEVLAQVS